MLDTRMKGRWLLRAGLVALGAFGFCAAETRAGFNDLLATNITGANVTQYNRVSGGPLGVFASSPLQFPQGITIGPDNNVYVSDLGNNTVQKFRGTDGTSLGTFVAAGAAGLNNPHSLVFGPNGDLFVTNNRGNNVLEYNGANGTPVATPIFASGGGLAAPTGLAFGLDGTLYVASSGSNAILKVTSAGGVFSPFATGLSAPAGVTVASDGTIFVANDGGGNVLRYNTSGSLLNTIIGGGLVHPSSIVFDGVGGMYVASSTLGQILRFNANLAGNVFSFDKVFATANLNTPIALALLPTVVPEPSSVILVGLGLVAAGGTVVRRARGSRDLVS